MLLLVFAIFLSTTFIKYVSIFFETMPWTQISMQQAFPISQFASHWRKERGAVKLEKYITASFGMWHVLSQKQEL